MPATRRRFLEGCFFGCGEYAKLRDLLKNKKNIILQGPPGVGKTFAAQGTAYSVWVKRYQPCQDTAVSPSYSYEDFIIGYRPTENGFKLTPGPFYESVKLLRMMRKELISLLLMKSTAQSE
jgi:5-methylcytosine-specific restriction protein B